MSFIGGLGGTILARPMSDTPRVDNFDRIRYDALLDQCEELSSMIQSKVNQDLLAVRVSTTTASASAKFRTQSTVGLMLHGCTIEGMVVGGPAFQSRALEKGDIISAIDDIPVDEDSVSIALIGNDEPGSNVVLTVHQGGWKGPLKNATLKRMPSSVIAERLRAFDLFTEIKQRAEEKGATEIMELTDQCITAWTRVSLSHADVERKVNEGVLSLQDKCGRWLRDMDGNLSELKAMQSLHLRRRDDDEQRFLSDKKEMEVARLTVQNLKVEVAKSRAALQDALRRAEEAEAASAFSERQIQDERDRGEEGRRRILELERHKAALESEMVTLHAELRKAHRKLTEEALEARSELQAAASGSAEQEAALTAARTEIVRLTADLEAAEAHARSVEELRRGNQDAHMQAVTELAKAKDELARVRREAEALQGGLSQSLDECRCVEEELRAWKAGQGELDSTARGLRGLLEEERELHADARRRCAAAASEVGGLRGQVAALEAQLGEARSRAVEGSASHSKLSARLEDLSRQAVLEAGHKGAALDKARAEGEKERAVTRLLKIELEAVRHALESAEEGHRRYAEQADRLRADLEAREAGLAQTLAQVQEEKGAMGEVLEGLRERVARAEGRAATLEAANGELRGELESVGQGVERTETALMKHKGALAAAEKELEGLRAESQALRQTGERRASDLKKTEERSAQLHADLKAAQGDLKRALAAVSELEEARQALVGERDTLKKQATTDGVERARAEEERDAATALRQKVQQRLEAVQEDCAALRRELAAAEARGDALQGAHGELEKELTAQTARVEEGQRRAMALLLETQGAQEACQAEAQRLADCEVALAKARAGARAREEELVEERRRGAQLERELQGSIAGERALRERLAAAEEDARATREGGASARGERDAVYASLLSVYESCCGGGGAGGAHAALARDCCAAAQACARERDALRGKAAKLEAGLGATEGLRQQEALEAAALLKAEAARAEGLQKELVAERGAREAAERRGEECAGAVRRMHAAVCRERVEAGCVGMTLRAQGALFVVVAMARAGPAAASGQIELGDVLASVDGTEIKGRALKAVTRLFAGEAGTPVSLAGLRGEARAKYHVKLVRCEARVDNTQDLASETCQTAKALVDEAQALCRAHALLAHDLEDLRRQRADEAEALEAARARARALADEKAALDAEMARAREELEAGKLRTRQADKEVSEASQLQGHAEKRAQKALHELSVALADKMRADKVAEDLRAQLEELSGLIDEEREAVREAREKGYALGRELQGEQDRCKVLKMEAERWEGENRRLKEALPALEELVRVLQQRLDSECAGLRAKLAAADEEARDIGDALRGVWEARAGDGRPSEREEELEEELEELRELLEEERGRARESAAEAQAQRAEKVALTGRAGELERLLHGLTHELEGAREREREAAKAAVEARGDAAESRDLLSRCSANVHRMHAAVCRGERAAGGGGRGEVGAVVCSAGGRVVVKHVVPGGAADACGEIAAGDALVSVDGRDVQGLSVRDVQRLFSGEPGTPVAICAYSRSRGRYEVVVVRGGEADGCAELSTEACGAAGRLHAELERLREASVEAQVVNEELGEELVRSKAACEEFRRERDECGVERARAEEEAARLSKELAAAKKEAEGLGGELGKSRAACAELTRARDAGDKEREKTREEAARLSKELARARKDAEEQLARAKAEAAELGGELGRSRAALEEAGRQRDACAVERERAEDTVAKISKQLEALRADVRKGDAELAEAREAVTKLEGKAVEQAAALEARAKEEAALRREAAGLRKEAADAVSKAAADRAAREEAGAAAVAAENVADKCRSRAKDLEFELSKAKAETVQVREELAKAEQFARDLRAELDADRKAHKALKGDLRKATARGQELQQQLEAAVKDKDQAVAALDSAVKEEASKWSVAQAESARAVERAALQLQQVEQQRDDLAQELEAVKKARLAAEDAARKTQIRATKADSRVEELFAELQKAQYECQTARRGVQGRDSVLIAEKKRNAAMVEELRNTVAELKKALMAEQSAGEKRQQRIEGLEKELSALKEKLQASETQCAKLVKDNEKVREELKKAMAELHKLQNCGVGMVVSESGRVAKIVEGGGAHATGEIRAGDDIKSIDGKSVKEMSLTALRARLQGLNGTTVTLGLLRHMPEGQEDKEFSVTINRGMLPPQGGMLTPRS